MGASQEGYGPPGWSWGSRPRRTTGQDTPWELRGSLHGEGLRVGVVVSRFNQFICQRLLEGCLEAFGLHGVAPADVTVAWVPGSFELPLAARQMAASGRYHAVICLGAVIRGETPHFDYVASTAASGISNAALDTGVPVTFGVLTTDNTQQAIERAGGKMGNKGYDVALAALEMVDLLGRLDPARPAEQ